MKKSILIAGIALLAACSQSKQEMNKADSKKEVPKMEVSGETLKEKLDAKKANFEAKADETKKTVYADGIKDIITNHIVENALQVGDQAPNFTLTNATGNAVTLQEQLEKGPVILMWYRGGWCPYCNLTLHAMQEKLPDFKKAGAILLALTPEVPDKSISTKEKNELEFEVLSDVDNKVARDYGVVFELTEAVKNYYETGFGLSEYNGNNKGELPLAATYIIEQDGTISYAFLDADYRNRAEPIAILEALKH